jgi:hypothetical protein
MYLKCDVNLPKSKCVICQAYCYLPGKMLSAMHSHEKAIISCSLPVPSLSPPQPLGLLDQFYLNHISEHLFTFLYSFWLFAGCLNTQKSENC